MAQGEVCGVGDAAFEPIEEGIDEDRLVAEPGQEGEVDVAGEPRFAPPLYGEATDEAVAPAGGDQDALDLIGGGEQTVQRRARAKMRCCSTRPDPLSGSGGRSGSSCRSSSAIAAASASVMHASSDRRSCSTAA